MRYRRLGRAGLKVSELSLGAWTTYGELVGEDAAEACMRAAYDAGVNFFDNAEAYGDGRAETQMGNVLARMGWARESYVVSTKIFWGGSGPNDRGLSHKHVIEGVHKALRRLRVEYVDLCYCHRPDPNTPIEETVRAMDILVRQGKVFYWGTSEWSAAEIMRADGIARQYGLTPPTMEQPQYNMFWRDRVEREYTPVFRDLGIGTTIWSPLLSGLLSGKYNAGVPAGSRLASKQYEFLRAELTAERIEKVKQLAPLAAELSCTQAQLALAWCLKNPNVSSVITGATRPAQVEENMRSLDVVPRLTDDVIARIEAVLDNRPEEPEV